MLTKPMLASPAELDKLDYSKGLLVSRKLDGIRALKVNGKLVSRTFKPIPNHFVRKTLENLVSLPDGVDGELLVGSSFQDSSSGIMSRDGEPDFIFAVFDLYDSNANFETRYGALKAIVKTINDPRVVLVEHHLVHSKAELIKYEEEFLEDGYEGLMVRSRAGPYKCGRASTREGHLLKVKRFEDSEAVVVGFEEQLHNANEAQKDAFGRTKRSSHQDNMVPKGVLGCLVVRDLKTNLEFGVGSGFDDAQRKALWNSRDGLRGKIIKYKFQPTGVKLEDGATVGVPRFPIFLGIRSPEDM